MSKRLMLAGMSESTARMLRGAVADLTVDAGYLQDWTYLEQACQQAKPDVVAIFLGTRPAQVLGLVRRTQAMFPDTVFLAVTDEAPASLVETLENSSVVDLVLTPECPGDMRRAIKALEAREHTVSIDGEVIALMGAKGGVGTTQVAANICAQLAAAHPDRRVVLVDLHVYLGDAAVCLDVTPKPSVLWFVHRGAVADARTWLEAPPKHSSGFQVLGLDGNVATTDPISAEQVVFLLDKLRSAYHYVIVDCGSEVNEVSLTACSTASQRVIITTDEIAARTGALRRLEALRAMDLPPPTARLVLNRAQNFTEEQRRELERQTQMPVVGHLSNAWQDMQKSLEAGSVLLQTSPRAQVTKDVAELVEAIAGRSQEAERRSRTFFNFFR